MSNELQKYEHLIPKTAPESLDDLADGLRMYSDQRVEVWYAPLGRRTSSPAVWILGITPGWNQMRIAYEGAAEALQLGRSAKEAAGCPKPRVAFAGTMRTNLIMMLDEIGLGAALGLASTEALFGTDLLRTGSVLRYPVFTNRKNYTGSSPAPTKHVFLKSMLDTIFAEELEAVEDCPIIPLGKAVESVLAYSAMEGRVDPNRVMTGFPHPSGANGHRVSQFNRNKGNFVQKIKQWY